MITIMGVMYMTEKEASNRYGFSTSWFQKRRLNKEYPKFKKLNGKGKVYYPIEDTDRWFQLEMKFKY